MTRLNLVLLLAVLASALYLVRTQYESRRLFAEIDRALGEARRLEIEHERLQLEKRAQATPLRVEKLAKEQLHMRGATPAITQYVKLRGELGGEAPATGTQRQGEPAAVRTP
jgi:cell division protein FtsL